MSLFAALHLLASFVKDSVSCITNQVNAFLEPVADLVDKGSRALSLGSNILKNVSSCFPNGFNNLNPIELMNDLVCAVGKAGPALNEVTTIITSVTSDISSVQSAFANTRNAVLVCPRERVANLVVQLGNAVNDFGKCLDAIAADESTATSS